MVETATEEKVPLEAKNKPFLVCGFLGVFWNLSYGSEDHLGSTRMVLNEDGEVKEALMYQPYGAVSDVQGISAPRTDPLRQKFTTKEFDEEGDENGAPGIQAYHFGARVYDPDIGVWMSTDPKDQDFNVYGYCSGNPIMLVDPNGENWLGALIGGVVMGYAQGAISSGSFNPAKWEPMDWYAAANGALSGAMMGSGIENQIALSSVEGGRIPKTQYWMKAALDGLPNYGMYNMELAKVEFIKAVDKTIWDNAYSSALLDDPISAYYMKTIMDAPEIYHFETTNNLNAKLSSVFGGAIPFKVEGYYKGNNGVRSGGTIYSETSKPGIIAHESYHAYCHHVGATRYLNGANVNMALTEEVTAFDITYRLQRGRSSDVWNSLSEMDKINFLRSRPGYQNMP